MCMSLSPSLSLLSLSRSRLSRLNAAVRVHDSYMSFFEGLETAGMSTIIESEAAFERRCLEVNGDGALLAGAGRARGENL